jgi:transcriptional regulator with XRE-family HTH domain
VTFQQIQKYENGANRVGAGRLQQMARVLDVPVSYFFAESAQSNDTPKNFDFLTTSYGARISGAFPRIRSKDLQLQIVGLIEALARD